MDSTYGLTCPYNQVTYGIYTSTKIYIIQYTLCEMTSLTSFVSIIHCLLGFHIQTENGASFTGENKQKKNKSQSQSTINLLRMAKSQHTNLVCWPRHMYRSISICCNLLPKRASSWLYLLTLKMPTHSELINDATFLNTTNDVTEKRCWWMIHNTTTTINHNTTTLSMKGNQCHHCWIDNGSLTLCPKRSDNCPCWVFHACLLWQNLFHSKIVLVNQLVYHDLS
jgi:hypothetical protein